ncbi:PIN domain-containing protein [Brevibacterium sp. JSBI002]|uniref:PIN domain-containing protein n=1 Tax=Brevibacterium sp. JSBI002 TaxID=2886045 RepID=UPI002231E719|nr:PIN domain-containing protein [Brevibacterium sp. JSBI002]UZD63598.1 PIN domain-containing protein [Brevibacterium sp. JSBI002]
MTQRVFVDANIFFRKTLIDWLFFLRDANEGMFQIHSTEDVFAEVLANMRKKEPQAAGSYTRRRLELIRKVVDEVIDNYPGNATFTGGDEHDYHVHAAALASRADFVLTADSPKGISGNPDLEPYEIISPDNFFLLVADSNPACIPPIINAQIAYWKKSEERVQLDDYLEKSGCPYFAKLIRLELEKMGRGEL